MYESECILSLEFKFSPRIVKNYLLHIYIHTKCEWKIEWWNSIFYLSCFGWWYAAALYYIICKVKYIVLCDWGVDYFRHFISWRSIYGPLKHPHIYIYSISLEYAPESDDACLLSSFSVSAQRIRTDGNVIKRICLSNTFLFCYIILYFSLYYFI